MLHHQIDPSAAAHGFLSHDRIRAVAERDNNPSLLEDLIIALLRFIFRWMLFAKKSTLDAWNEYRTGLAAERLAHPKTRNAS